MTGPELEEYLVKLAMEAWDRAHVPLESSAYFAPVNFRPVFEREVRERMKQAAMTIMLEVDFAKTEALDALNAPIAVKERLTMMSECFCFSCLSLALELDVSPDMRCWSEPDDEPDYEPDAWPDPEISDMAAARYFPGPR